MKTNQKKNREKNEAIQIPTIRFFLMRHGEPLTYGDRDSHLSLNGKKQARDKAKLFIKLCDDGNSHNIKIFYSNRTRAIETCIELEKELKKLNKNSEIKIFKPVSKKIMQTADPLNTLVNASFPLKSAYKKWLELPEEKLKSLGIQTPEELRNSFLDFSLNLFKKLNPEIYTEIIGITHETTLLAFQKKLFPSAIQRPKFTEIMEISFLKPNVLNFKYRGKEKKIYVQK